YSFSNNNLSKREHFFDQSQYNFNYQTETFESGLGSGSSNLGKGLSFQKSFYSSYKHVYDSLNTLMGIVSISPFDGETNLGFGYSYKQKDVILSSSVGAGLGTSSNENSISFKQEGSMKFINKHRLTFRLSGIWEENFEAKRYSEMGYSHNITYVAPFGNYLKLWASHRFGSSSFPGSERGLSAFTSNLNYLFPKSHYVVHAAWNKIKLNPEMYDDEHRMLPESNVDKQSYSLKLSSPGTNYLGYGIGSSFTTLDTSTEIDENSVEEVSIKIYNLMMSGRLNGRYFNYKTNLSVGFINDRSGNKRPDFKLKSSAQNRNYGFAVEYQDGNAGGDYSVKQRIEKRLSISPYYKKVLFRKNLLINANTQYNYNFLSNRGRLSFNAGIDGLLRNNWKIHLASRIDCQLVKSYTAGNCKLASLEIGISKGISFSRREIEYYDVSIKFFKDENGNGVKDKEESGIGNMIAGITKTAPLPGKENATNEGHAADHFKFISLASNKQGDIKMEYMPEGIYEVNITSSKNLYGYFNFKGNEHVFQLDEEKTVNIPYEKAGKIYGQLKIKRDAFSDMGLVSAEDIRIVAVSSEGKEFTSLTGRNGQFILYVP
ncbi:MAG: hypothetical protein U9R19_16460, partial [Bacteroidota bacterium]|nr:hypothetical protein [Bacteroidota bacterium]